MEAYIRVATKPETEADKPQQNEIRVTAQGKKRKYILYATNLLETNGAKTITLKAMGKAIRNTVSIAEIIKRRVPGLHQLTEIGSAEITETYTPKETGLEQVTHVKHVSSIQIVLSLEPLDTTAPGYQAPLPVDSVKPPVPRKFPRPFKQQNPQQPNQRENNPQQQNQQLPPQQSFPPRNQHQQNPHHQQQRGPQQHQQGEFQNPQQNQPRPHKAPRGGHNQNFQGNRFNDTQNFSQQPRGQPQQLRNQVPQDHRQNYPPQQQHFDQGQHFSNQSPPPQNFDSGRGRGGRGRGGRGRGGGRGGRGGQGVGLVPQNLQSIQPQQGGYPAPVHQQQQGGPHQGRPRNPHPRGQNRNDGPQ